MLAFILAVALTGGSCANPSILSAVAKTVTPSGALTQYSIIVTVQNLGDMRQPSNLLQSVDVFQDGDKVDRIGLQPLRPKQSQRVTYRFVRAADAGAGTTELTFRLDFNGRSGNDVDCRAGMETYTILV